MSSRLNPAVQYAVGAKDATKTQFDFTFRALNPDDIKVVLDNGQALTSYTVNLNENGLGGYVKFMHAFAVGTRITIYREMVFSRQTGFRENENFHASVINEEFDRMIMLLQQAGNLSKNSIHQPNHDVEMDMILPTSAQRADKLLGFDGQGRPQVLSDPSIMAKEAESSAKEAKKNADIAQRNRKMAEQEFAKVALHSFAKKDLSNVNMTSYATKSDVSNISSFAKKDLGNITDTTFKAKGVASGLSKATFTYTASTKTLNIVDK